MTDSGYLVEQVVLLCLFGFIFVLNAIQLAVERRMHADVERYQGLYLLSRFVGSQQSAAHLAFFPVCTCAIDTGLLSRSPRIQSRFLSAG